MQTGRKCISAVVLCGACLSARTFADTVPIVIHTHDAARIVFQDQLDARQNFSGDQFNAKVDGDDGVLPKGTLLIGRVIGAHPASRRHPASMEMQFTDVQLPDGYRQRIVALPVSADDKHIVRDANGRLIAKYNPGQGAGYVVGGAVGGLIVGSIVHRPIAGTLIGTLIGSIAAASDRHQNENLIVAKGQKMVAVFERDSVIDESIKNPDPVIPGGWHTTEGSGRHPRPDAPVQGTLIRYGDKTLSFGASTAPFWDAGVLLVPVDQTAQQLGLDVSHKSDGRITLQADDARIDVKTDSTAYLFNDDGGDMKHAVVEKDGIVYVPIDLLAALRPDKIVVNGNTLHWKSS